MRSRGRACGFGGPTASLRASPRGLDAAVELIKGHAQAGFDVLVAIDFPWPVAEIALQHHERLDGSGYPSAFAVILHSSMLPASRLKARGLPIPKGHYSKGRPTGERC